MKRDHLGDRPAFAFVLAKVPATPEEALRTSLMGIFEKRRFRSFLMYLAGYDEDQPETYQGKGSWCETGLGLALVLNRTPDRKAA